MAEMNQERSLTRPVAETAIAKGTIGFAPDVSLFPRARAARRLRRRKLTQTKIVNRYSLVHGASTMNAKHVQPSCIVRWY